MDQEEMKVGPKGQIVIPNSMRRALKLTPGSKVLVTLENGKVVIEKPASSSVDIFEKISLAGPSITILDPHQYEEEIEERTKR